MAELRIAATGVSPSATAQGVERLLASHLPALDGWRGLAIAGVLYSHFVAGGTKKRQQRDIEAAQAPWAAYKRRKRSAR